MTLLTMDTRSMDLANAKRTFTSLNGLLNVAVKPVGVGVKAVTKRPWLTMVFEVPVIVGMVEVVSVAEIV